MAAEENPAEKQQNKRSDQEESQIKNLEENETVQEEEKLAKIMAAPALTAGEPEKVRLPLQKLENAVKTAAKDGADEIMLALESHLPSVSRVS